MGGGLKGMPQETREAGAVANTIPHVTVRDLVEDRRLTIELKRVAGEAGLDRPLRHPRVQKNGLALVGHHQGVVPTRVQVVGETELSYLDSLSNDARSVAARGYFSLGLSCMVIAGRREAPKAFVTAAEATSTPLYISDARSSRTINALHAVLDDRLAPQTQLHGVLVDVYGVGILLLGKSGVGKSECALELVRRGHCLVADDVVQCDWRPPGHVFGQPAELLRHHIEIRGLGVLDIRALFGISAIRDRKRLDLVVQLCEWTDRDEFDRLGIEERHHTILGTPLREHRVPVRPGRDMSSIIEMAARNELLRRDGRHTAREFLQRLEGKLMDAPPGDGAEDRLDSPAPGEAEPTTHKPSWSTLMPQATRTESSAWIPAVRPPKEGEE